MTPSHLLFMNPHQFVPCCLSASFWQLPQSLPRCWRWVELHQKAHQEASEVAAALRTKVTTVGKVMTCRGAEVCLDLHESDGCGDAVVFH